MENDKTKKTTESGGSPLNDELVWQLIDTAPKDLNLVLLYRDYSYFVGYYGGANSGWRINAPGMPAMWPLPTHWMLLPKMPNAKLRGGLPDDNDNGGDRW